MHYEIKIHQQKRNTLVLRISPGTMDVMIPNWLKDDSPQVVQFIERGKARFGERIPPKSETPFSEAQILVLVHEWATRIGTHPKRVQMRTMYRKWGSCSRRKTITLDSALGQLPFRLIDYVVCHEVAHLLEFNHEKGFQDLMSHHMPDWQERKRELTGFDHFN
jgi:predicted metal-dependent hydrolase